MNHYPRSLSKRHPLACVTSSAWKKIQAAPKLSHNSSVKCPSESEQTAGLDSLEEVSSTEEDWSGVLKPSQKARERTIDSHRDAIFL